MGKRLRRRAFALALLAVPVSAGAQSSAPLDFLNSIYEPYKQAGFKGQPYWEARRFFVADLAEAIERDFAEAKKRNEVPTLDGDPFIDAQDWSIGEFRYTMRSEVAIAGHGAALVNFRHLDTPKQLMVFLTKTPQGWRIHDILRGSSSLRALYKFR